MKKTINILVIEDSEDDFHLLLRMIRKEGYEVNGLRIETRNEMVKNLKSNWDIILCDNNLPAFDAPSALKILREISLIIPFIIVSGEISAEDAVKAMRSGANDYIMKNDLIRLIPAIEREIEEYRIKKEKERIQIQLHRSREKYELLAQNIQDMVCLVNSHGNYIWVSPSCERILGFSQEKVKKLGPIGILHTDNKEKVVKEIFEPLKAGSLTTGIRFTSKCITSEGGSLFLETIVEPIFSNGKLEHFATTSRDITELVEYRNNLEMMVVERTNKLYEALRKEKELVAVKSRFVAIASHEFRTPLSTITFASDFIKKYFDQVDQLTIKQKLTKIDEQVLHMINLLDDVLLLGKSEGQKIKINAKRVFLKEFIENLTEEVENSTGNTHSIMTYVGSGIDEVYLGESLLRNILINLLTNAIKFSPGKNTINLDVDSIDGGDTLIFKVKDRGIGINEEDIEKIFDPFHRNENVGEIHGTGLGLSIVKRAIDLHKGMITVTSKLGEGSTFSFRISQIYESRPMNIM